MFGLRFWLCCVYVFLFYLFIYLLRSAFHVGMCLSVGPVHCVRDPQPL